MTDDKYFKIPTATMTSNISIRWWRTSLLDWSAINFFLIANKSFVNIHDSWGAGHTTGSDTHFINYAGGTGSRGNYNVAHIDTRNKFRLIGDLEVYSGSVNIPNDFTNHHNLHNREILSDDVHGDITYESYINGNPG